MRCEGSVQSSGGVPSTMTRPLEAMLRATGAKNSYSSRSFALLEMKIVLSAVLGTRELRVTGDGYEMPRRRNITIRPSEGAVAVLG